MATDLLERCYPGRRAELKRQILAKALECFNQQGIEATTIEQIREGCQASVGAFYHHFGNKEGLVAALFFAALDDQTALRDSYLAKAGDAMEAVSALVYSYIDWVDQNPEWARYQYQARHGVATGQHGAELLERNRKRNAAFKTWLSEPESAAVFSRQPAELVLSFLIGPSESYARAWLSGRVKSRPSVYREDLAKAAWRAISGD